MQVDSTTPIRFLLFPRGEELTISFSQDTSIQMIKLRLMQDWPKNLEPVNSIEQIRLVFCGKFLNNNQTLQEVLNISQEGAIPTVHVVVKREQPQVNANKNQSPMDMNQGKQEVVDDVPDDWHLHGCVFNEEEADQMKIIFQRKKGLDDLLDLVDIQKFLEVYWKWMIRNQYHTTAKPFPKSLLDEIKQKVLKNENRASYEQFLQIFFLFDNDAPERTCPHGARARVEKSTEQLHKALKGPQASMQMDVFQSVFNGIDQDHDGVLSCKEIELFFYMYSARVSNSQ